MPRRTTTGTTSSNEALYAFDTARRAEHGTVCGVDEAGRGPLCGPVCCAAVILNPDDPIEGVNDSKKLTEKRRDALYEEITKRALAYKIVFISPQEIDERNILWATMDGMAQLWRAGNNARLCADRRQPLPAGLIQPPRPSSRATPTVRRLRRRRFWQRSAVTAICWSWTSSTRSISWQSTRLPHKAALRADCAVRYSAVLPPQLP